MRTVQEEEADDLEVEVDVEGRDWIIEDFHGMLNKANDEIDELVEDFGGRGQIRVHIDIVSPEYKSWSFSIPEINYNALEKKLDSWEDSGFGE